MGTEQFTGVMLHWIGGLAAASFLIPYRGVKKWSWETYWLVGGLFSWIIAPWIGAWLLVPDLKQILSDAWSADAHVHFNLKIWVVDTHMKVVWLTYLFGVLWGIGGLTFGLTMRYLGIALGYAVALGLCTALGTLVPPIFDGTFGELLHQHPGQVTLAGIGVCLVGIVFSGLAGMSKEREMTDEQKKKSVSEFSFVKGMLVALFAGAMSSAMAYGFSAGKPIAELAKASLLAHGKSDLWQNLPVLIIVLAGGFTTNFIWCAILNLKNRSAREYVGIAATGGPVGSLLPNYIFAALAGVLWYLQFFFYGMGTTKMGKFDFSSWTLHMASIIIFSTLWGVALKEWRGTSKRTHAFIAVGLIVLISSTIIVGYGNYLKSLR